MENIHTNSNDSSQKIDLKENYHKMKIKHQNDEEYNQIDT